MHPASPALLLKVQRLHPAAQLPAYQTPGAACFDLHALEETLILPGTSQILRTGLAFEIPPAHVMLVYSRSGHGFTHDLRLGNATGVIDSDYRGELLIKLRSDRPTTHPEPFPIRAGDRIAQALLLPVPAVILQWADTLTPTTRGTNGFGSTDTPPPLTHQPPRQIS